MVTSAIALVTALLGLIALIVQMVKSDKSEEEKKAEELAHVEEDEANASMARVDADYQRMRDAGK